MVATGRNKLGFFVLGAAAVIGIAACSSSGSEESDEALAEPTMESAAVDEASDTSGTEEVTDNPDPALVESLFTAQYWPELGLSGVGFQIADVVGLDDNEFLVVGIEVDPEARTRVPRVVHIGGPTGNDTLSDAALPTGGSTDVQVSSATEHEGEVIVVGSRQQDGLSIPVLWSGSVSDGEYSFVDLLASADQNFVSRVADDGSAVAGVVIDGGIESAAAWVREGDNWVLFTLPDPDGAPESYASDVMATENGHLVSGWGFSPVDARRWPMVWEITARGVTGHPVDVGIESLTITGITEGPNSSILVVGEEVQTTSDPLVFVADGPAGPWRRIDLTADADDRFSNRGFGLAGVDRRKDRLVTWSDTRFTRVVFSSSDGGASWAQQGFLGAMGDGGIVVNGVGVSESSILAGGYHDLFRWTGSAWEGVRSAALSTHDGLFSQTSVAHGNDGFVVAGEFRDPGKGTTSPGSLRIYALVDGEWSGQSVAESGLKEPSQFVQSGDQLALIGTGLTFNDDPLPVWNLGNDQWTITEHDQIGGLRSLPIRSVGDGEGGILTIANEVETSDIEVIPRLFTAQGETTGSVSSSADSNDLQRVRCLLKAWDGYLTVLEYNTQTLVLTAGPDLAFTELEPATEVAIGMDVVACVMRGDELLMALRGDGDRLEIATVDSAGAETSRQPLPDGFSISGFLQAGDVTLAFGSSDVTQPETGAVAWESDDGWQVVGGPESGLAPDDFGRWTFVTGVHLLSDEVVLTGSDVNGRVFWTADRAEFFTRLGVDDDGELMSSPPDLG